MTGAAKILELVDTAEPFEPAAAPLDAAAMRAFGLAEMDQALAGLRAATDDERAPALAAAAERVGQLVGAGALVQGFARAVIEEAARDAGLIRDLGLKEVRAAIGAALKRGQKQPADMDTMRRGAAQKKQRRPRPAAVRTTSSPEATVGAKAGHGVSCSPALSDPAAAAPPSPPEGDEDQSETLANDDDGDASEREEDNGDDGASGISSETFRYCAALDQSDVDNGKRLIAYFGEDLLVRQEDDVPAGQMLAWTGTHWDLAGGEALAHLIGQRVGDLIKIEASYLEHTPSEARAVRQGDAAAEELKGLAGAPETVELLMHIAELEERIKAGKRARAALSTRRSNRRKWGVSTKNASRIANMIKCAAPHLRRHPDLFNADALKFATLTHTISFVPVTDPENPEPDTTRPLINRETGRVQYRLQVTEGHDRADMITAIVPFAYDRAATAPKFAEFLDLFQPDHDKRRTIQQFCGMSLTAQPVQRVMYHTGTGGNGKSVFLEVLARVLGDGLAVGLPAESVSGEAHNNPSAPTPDIARCYAKRFLRVAELPKDAPLKQEMIKKLTGGEKWPVRTMYKGYFEFKPTAKPHMSGNGEPKFDGSDGGMQRRLIIVPWSVTLPTEKHRDFEDVVSEIVAGGSGILNWLIDGALDFLNSGLMISDEVLKVTAEHFAEMDPCQRFIEAHVRPDPGGPGVTGRAMYEAYKLWCEANGASKMFETKFGLTMKKKLTRDDSRRVRVYVDVRLVDLPEPESRPNEAPEYEPGDMPF